MISITPDGWRASTLDVDYTKPYAVTEQPKLKLCVRQSPESDNKLKVEIELMRPEAEALLDYLRRALEGFNRCQ